MVMMPGCGLHHHSNHEAVQDERLSKSLRQDLGNCKDRCRADAPSISAHTYYRSYMMWLEGVRLSMGFIIALRRGGRSSLAGDNTRSARGLPPVTYLHQTLSAVALLLGTRVDNVRSCFALVGLICMLRMPTATTSSATRQPQPSQWSSTI